MGEVISRYSRAGISSLGDTIILRIIWVKNVAVPSVLKPKNGVIRKKKYSCHLKKKNSRARPLDYFRTNHLAEKYCVVGTHLGIMESISFFYI